MTQNPNLAALSAAGVSVWLDDLCRAGDGFGDPVAQVAFEDFQPNLFGDWAFRRQTYVLGQRLVQLRGLVGGARCDGIF